MSMSDDPRAVSPPSDAELWRNLRGNALSYIGLPADRSLAETLREVEALAQYLGTGQLPALPATEPAQQAGEQ